MTKKTLTDKEIEHISDLSKLKLSNNEVKRIGKQLTDTLNFVENLNSLDTSNVFPTSQISNLVNVFFEDGEANTRQLDYKQSLSNTRRKKNNYFEVNKVLDQSDI